jgi:flavin-dependent dehydrogenase
MHSEKIYDCAIVGGGLAGLTLAIRLAKQRKSVVVFEKDQYPKHRVCGEYISLETVAFLKKCGFDVYKYNLPIIKKLEVSAPDGTVVKHNLTLGGFGISRYKFDYELYKIAIESGVNFYTQTKVNDIVFANRLFEIITESKIYQSKTCVGSFGKRSNLDIKWNRTFLQKNKARLANYVGVKYHIKCNLAEDVIQLHNFEDGYCGISKIENDLYCMCYLTTSDAIKKAGNISNLQTTVLKQNKYLKYYFENAEFVFKEPITISQINFLPKKTVENHVLMIGDSAGLIAPLCGNGMAMAMHGAAIAEVLIVNYLENKISYSELENLYTKQWKSTFGTRIWVGRNIQKLFGKSWITNLLIRSVKPFPKIVSLLEKSTHGEVF